MNFPPATDIRKIRIGMDITQSDLAARSGISQSTIAKIERGKISASYETVVSLFNTLEAMRHDIGKGLTAADVCSKSVVSIQSDETIQSAARLMEETGYSQFPVFNGTNPVGSISERDIFDLISSGRMIDEVYRLTVSNAMGDSFPVVSGTTPISTVAGMMSSCNAVLVSDKGSIKGMITKADMLKLI
ncbi:MAG: CBS domain-containing protein [Thermoplasmata archaeon]|nr:CBS domain-containing protein [Thermoplasmata archaeon]